jgi:hypothetical protein
MNTNLKKSQIIELSRGDDKCFKITLNQDKPIVEIIKENFQNIEIRNYENITKEKIINYSTEIIQSFFKKISRGKTSVEKSVKTICSSLFFQLDNILNSVFINQDKQDITTSLFTIKMSKYYPQIFFSSKQFIALKILLMKMYKLDETNKQKIKLSKLYKKYNSYPIINLSEY